MVIIIEVLDPIVPYLRKEACSILTLIMNCVANIFLLFVGSENQAEIVEESIQHAKEAITLDVKDGNSWCKILHQNYFMI